MKKKEGKRKKPTKPKERKSEKEKDTKTRIEIITEEPEHFKHEKEISKYIHP